MKTQPPDRSAGTAPQTKFLVDPYADWAAREGIPVHLDFGHDLLVLETAPWPRYDARGCFAHTHGRGDFIGIYVLEVPPAGKTRPLRHLYEAVFYVLDGNGSTMVWMPNGEARSFEWGPKALFAIPLNCRYQIFNGTGTQPARLSCTNNAPITINLYHNLDFVFDNPFTFPERVGQTKHFDGEGEYEVYNRADERAIAHIWETNFVPDLDVFKLYDLDSRGKGSKNVIFALADGTMHAHVSEIPTGRYKKAHRHAAGAHVHAVSGEGYSLLWYEGDSDFREIPWRHGIMYAPPFWMFHQHFNTCGQPARYLACNIGSRRYPLVALRRRSAEGGGATSVLEGGRQIEYGDQDPRIHRRWLEGIAANGVRSLMGDIFNEPAILAMPEEAFSGKIRTPASVGPAI
jgi:hypothetical protein